MSSNFETLNDVLNASLPDSAGGDSTTALGRVLPTSSTLEGIRLYRSNTEEFIILPWNPVVTSKPPLSTLTFKESLFNGCIFGSIVLFDIRNWVDEFKFTGNEKLEIKFRIGSSPKVNTMTFHVYDAKSITDESYTQLLNAANERVSLWKLEFISSQIFLPNYNQTILEQDEDFVGRISGEDDGLIETIYNKLQFKINKIDPSKNGIWLKYDHISHPWMKFKGQSKIPQLLNYLANHAWSGQNYSNYYADYFFWEDRDGWNFRSVTEMLQPNGKKVSPSDGFIITIDKMNPKRILNFQVVSEYNIQKLLDSYSLFSFYDRYDPNFENPYHKFLDSNDAFVKKTLTYDYHKMYQNMVMIDDYKLIPDNFDTSPKNEFGKIKQTARIDDVVYGYYANEYLHTPTPIEWDVYGRGRSGSIPWHDNSWQPQFDTSELLFQDFKTIHEKIRKPLISKRAEFARKKNIKRKWEVYRCTVCCHENGALGSPEDIAILQNPGPIGGITYDALFGPKGMYSNKNSEYRIVAAGSFTDLFNYNISDQTSLYGMTLSYDLSKAPYNQSIGEFFNIKGPNPPAPYTKFVVERATKLYDLIIQKINTRINDINNFLENVDDYKKVADDNFKKVLIDTQASYTRPVDLSQGFRYIGPSNLGVTGLPEWPVNQTEFGLVPSTSIPVNQGVAQVIFGDPPPVQIPPPEDSDYDGIIIG